MMTQPDDAHRGESQASMAPQDRLRKDCSPAVFTIGYLWRRSIR
jgi:hypothetical protein